ncbi:hypothetical protein GCM10023338_18630 [Wohlfahrtiimonas larvae]|uniref:DUF4124 domain-containing protein n=2 Tax=Wohlfahrtiimonas larvae TaxID=1157986 RepID=A0ABP9MU16_9GAMM
MYRWTDSKGVVHYTEYAPDEVRQQILNFDKDQPRVDTSAQDVKKLDIMQPTQAVLVEIEEKQNFDPADRKNTSKGVTIPSKALDPSTMTYCQIIHKNLETFTALENGEFDQLLLVAQSGAQTRISPENIQTQYKTTIDNLEKYCLQ